MDKVTVGIPRGIPYYYDGEFWKFFFQKCNIEVLNSPSTTQEIVDRGISLAPDEMCLSMKIYLGHLDYLEGKCDYLFVPRIDRFDDANQTCTNFLSFYDLAKTYFKTPILNYNIDCHNDLLDGALEIGSLLSIPRVSILKAYDEALEKAKEIKRVKNKKQLELLKEKQKKVLIVSHAYNIHDALIGSDLLKMLKENGIIVLYSDYFLSEDTNPLASKLSKKLYWKYSRDSIGAIPLCEDVNGIIFLSTFPCGLDSLVHELVIRKIKKPYLNLVIDNLSSFTGLETRVESFVDLLEQS